jgi:hypothetical protein
MNVFICDSSRFWSYKTARDVGVRRFKNQSCSNSQTKRRLEPANLPGWPLSGIASTTDFEARMRACMNFGEILQGKKMEIIWSEEGKAFV